MKHTIEQYIEASCGIGKYYTSGISLLRRLRKTKRPRWAGFNVSDLTKAISESLELKGINTEEVIK